MRLLIDPTLPDSARQLSQAEFWDGREESDENEKIIISVEIKDFQDDLDVLALTTDFRLDDDPETVRLTYEFRPKPGLRDQPAFDDDYELYATAAKASKNGSAMTCDEGSLWTCYLPSETLKVISPPGDGSPLRPLIERAFSSVERADLESIKVAIERATAQLEDFETVERLEEDVAALFATMSGPKQDIKPRLGFGATDMARLLWNIRLLIDDGRRTINDASLGSANIVFLTLKALELKSLMDENRRDHTLLAIEEPEAHLHPHLQRSVYRHLFEVIGSKEDDGSLSILLTTHSPHIASVAPLRSILLLKDGGEKGTVGCSTAGIPLTKAEEDDLARYLDVTRAEMLFATRHHSGGR